MNTNHINPDSAVRREGARQADGKFGTQEHAEAAGGIDALGATTHDEGWDAATPEQEADYLAGYVDGSTFRETEHGLEVMRSAVVDFDTIRDADEDADLVKKAKFNARMVELGIDPDDEEAMNDWAAAEVKAYFTEQPYQADWVYIDRDDKFTRDQWDGLLTGEMDPMEVQNELLDAYEEQRHDWLKEKVKTVQERMGLDPSDDFYDFDELEEIIQQEVMESENSDPLGEMLRHDTWPEAVTYDMTEVKPQVGGHEHLGDDIDATWKQAQEKVRNGKDAQLEAELWAQRLLYSAGVEFESEEKRAAAFRTIASDVVDLLDGREDPYYHGSISIPMRGTVTDFMPWTQEEDGGLKPRDGVEWSGYHAGTTTDYPFTLELDGRVYELPGGKVKVPFKAEPNEWSDDAHVSPLRREESWWGRR